MERHGANMNTERVADRHECCAADASGKRAPSWLGRTLLAVGISGASLAALRLRRAVSAGWAAWSDWLRFHPQRRDPDGIADSVRDCGRTRILLHAAGKTCLSSNGLIST